MMSINEQIGMPIPKRGQSMYMPALYGNTGLDEITSLSEPRAVVIGTAYWQNAQGINEDTADSWGLNSTWSGCNSCGNFTGEEAYNYATGNCVGITASTPPQGVVACANGRAVYVPAVWIALKATKKGREKIEHNRCVCLKRKEARKPNDIIPDGGTIDDGSIDTKSSSSNDDNSPTGNAENKTSNGLIIGLSLAGVALVGVVIYLVKKNR